MRLVINGLLRPVHKLGSRLLYFVQSLRPSISRAFAADAVSSQSSGGEEQLRQGWDELQSIATTNEGRKELADLRRLVSELTLKPEPVDFHLGNLQ